MRLLAGVRRATRTGVLAALMLGAFTAAASASSALRPGPAILYEPTAVAPELTNTGIWQATPILVSGSTEHA